MQKNKRVGGNPCFAGVRPFIVFLCALFVFCGTWFNVYASDFSNVTLDGDQLLKFQSNGIFNCISGNDIDTVTFTSLPYSYTSNSSNNNIKS